MIFNFHLLLQRYHIHMRLLRAAGFLAIHIQVGFAEHFVNQSESGAKRIDVSCGRALARLRSFGGGQTARDLRHYLIV